MNSKCKIVVVDDHKMFREGLRFLLSEMSQVEFAGEAEDGKQFLELIEHTRPDIVLMDISMPNINGVEATLLGLQKYPEMKVIALTMFGEEDYYYKMIHAGAKGFLLKESGSTELAFAIREVAAGNNYFSIDLLKNVIISIGKDAQKNSYKINELPKLTPRETEVLKLICTGLSAKEIANELSISPRTVEMHKNHLFEKTQTQNTSSLIMTAIRYHLIEL